MPSSRSSTCPAGATTAAVADLLVDETLRDPGCVEVGYSGRRAALDRRSRRGAVRSGNRQATRRPDSVFVVTGAAGSIVSAITADLAAASGGTFHLLDLTPAPDPDDPDLQRFVTDKDGLKSDLAARLKERRPASHARADREGARSASNGSPPRTRRCER